MECYYDNEDWKGGLKASDEAFQHIPASEQKPLWEYRMLFLSKLGHDVAVAISKMKVSDETLMAKVWMKLGSNSVDRKDQLAAYLSAIQLLQNSWARVYVIIELADWMQSNSAIDILLDFETPASLEDDEEDVTEADESSVARSKTSSAAPSTVQSGSKRRESNASKSINGGKSVNTSASGKKSGGGGGSRTTKGAGSVAKTRGSAVSTGIR